MATTLHLRGMDKPKVIVNGRAVSIEVNGRIGLGLS
jgi:hypothetical protein